MLLLYGCGGNKKIQTPRWISEPHPSGKYGTVNPGERFEDVVKEFGPPSVYDPSPGGVAIWDSETLKAIGSCFDRIEVRDEMVPHGKPANHVDFLYTWYSLDIPVEQICDVIDLSTSISYDPLKKMIRVRCHFMGANVVTLWLVTQMVDNGWSLERAKKEYGPRIMELSKENSELYNKYITALCNKI